MAQPRRPKGESGPAKSSKHREKALETGLYQDDSRMNALESLLGAAAVNSTSSSAPVASSSKKSGNKKSSAREVEGDSAPRIRTKKTSLPDPTASSSSTGQEATGGSHITSEDILALLARIEKKSSGEIQLLRSINSLVSAYSVVAHTPQQQQQQQNKSNNNDDGKSSSTTMMGNPEDSTVSSSSASTAVAGGASDDIIVPTVSTFCEQLQMNAFHPNIAVRRGFATALNHLLSRGSEVRQAVGATIAKTFGPWLALAGDEVNREVSRPAKEALDKTFAVGSSKRVQLFSKFGARACKKMLEDLAMFLNTRKSDFAVTTTIMKKNDNTSNSDDQNQAAESAAGRDTGDSQAGIAVGQILGALSLLITELSSTSGTTSSFSKKSTASSASTTDQQDPFAQAKKEVSLLLATALGFVPSVNDDDDDDTTSTIMSRTTTTDAFAQQQQPLSFSQKKMKNKNKAGGGNKAGPEDKPAEGAAVFGATSSSNFADPNSVVNQQGASPIFGVFSIKCLPQSEEETSSTTKPIISTSLRLQQNIWSLMSSVILFSCVCSKSASQQYILDYLPKSMTGVLFSSSSTTTTSAPNESENELLLQQTEIAVQQSFWSSLISTLHQLASSSSFSSGSSFFCSSLRKTLWPSIMDVLDNVAEGDIKVLPVALLDAVSSVVLLLEKNDKSINLSPSSENTKKGMNLLTSLFDKLTKVARREFTSWQQKKQSHQNSFMTAMRALLEFTGTTLSIIFAENASSSLAQELSSHCFKGLMSFVFSSSSSSSNQEDATVMVAVSLSSMIDEESLTLEMKKLPASLPLLSQAANKTNLMNQQQQQDVKAPASKMILDISDRFAGWTLLAAKNTSTATEASKALLETVLQPSLFAASSNNNYTLFSMASLVSLQIVKRWLNLESATAEMTTEAMKSLSNYLSSLSPFSSSSAKALTLPISYHQLVWFLREISAATLSNPGSTKAPEKTKTVVQKLQMTHESLLVSTFKLGISKMISSSSSSGSVVGENEVKTFTRIICTLLLFTSSSSSKAITTSFADCIFSHTTKKEEKKEAILLIIESVSQIMASNNNNHHQSSSVSLIEALILSLLTNYGTDSVFVNKVVRKLLRKTSSASASNNNNNNQIQRQLWGWLQIQAENLVDDTDDHQEQENETNSKYSNNNNNNNNKTFVSTFESLLSLVQTLLSLSSSSKNNKTNNDYDNHSEEEDSKLKTLESLANSCLIRLACNPTSKDSFVFVGDELKEALDEMYGNDDDDESNDEDEEENEEDEESNNDENGNESNNKKNTATTTTLTAQELRTQFDNDNQTFLRLFDSWASACEELAGGNALVVSFASKLEVSLSSSGHIPLLGAALRANRFPESLAQLETWNQLIEGNNSKNNNNNDTADENESSSTSSNAFSLLSLLNTFSAKRFSVHDFAVAQFPTGQVIDFACDAEVSPESIANAGRLFVTLAEALHATGFKGEVEKDDEAELQDKKNKNKLYSKSTSFGDDEDEDDEEYEDEEEESGDDDDNSDESDSDIDDPLQQLRSANNQQQNKASLPAPARSVGSKLILPVMQILSVRNLWTTKVRESLKFILSWCLDCLLPSSSSHQTASSSSSSSASTFLDSGAVSGLAQTCVSICINYSEKAPFLLTGPLALLAQMYTNTKDVRYDRLLRAIYSSVSNAWAMDTWRFSPNCFCPWPGSALDSLLWSALMPRGVSLPKEALDKLRRAITMSPAGAPSSLTQDEKNVKAVNNAIHAMYLLSLLPERLAAEAPPIEVNHVVQAMRSINMTVRSAGAAKTEKTSSSPDLMKQSVYISGLALFAALSRCVILSSNALPEVAANAVNCLTQSYHLELLPPAGKFAFQQQKDDNNSGIKTISEDSSRRIIQSLSALRHGVKARYYKDDGLISTMNLCVLDIGCSLGVKLQKYANNNSNSEEEDEDEDEEQRLLLVAYDVSKFLSSEFLSQDDLRALRASAATVDPIARFVIGTHFWLCARPLKLFAFEDFIGKATTILNLAAQLAVSILIGCRPLIKNDAIMTSLVQIFGRPPLRLMSGRQQVINEVAKMESDFNERIAKEIAGGTVSGETFMSDRSKLARILTVPQKQLSFQNFKRHTKFLMSNAKMRVTSISYFVLSYVYLSLSDDDSISQTVSGTAVVQAADLILCGLTLHQDGSGKAIWESTLHSFNENANNINSRGKSSKSRNNRQNHNNNNNNNIDDDEELMSPYLEISKIADPKWLQPAAKSPVVNPAQLRAQCGRWAASVLGLLIQRPAIVTLRHWRETLHHTSRDAITQFIDTHFSPYLSKMALFDVVAHAPVGEMNTLMARTTCSFHPPEELGGDNITIEVDHEKRFVLVRFDTDEIETRIAIRVPTGYPLRTAHITDKDIGIKGVSESKRRSWLLKMSASLLNGTASLWSAVSLFCTNLAKEFEGIEPCPICYMITSGNELPSMTCKVCKNAKFHKSCLTQWWATAPQSICPMCRSPWFAA